MIRAVLFALLLGFLLKEPASSSDVFLVLPAADEPDIFCRFTTF